jgi:hypothetical protein
MAWLKALLLCAAAPGIAECGEAVEFLDRSTGTTLHVTRSPWILALEQPLLAAHARDYVALYGVVTSNGGKRQQFLAAFYWSTVPGRNRHAGDRPGLRLLLDDLEKVLDPVEGTPRDAGIGRWPLQPPGRDALLMLYSVEPGLLRILGHASRLRLRPLPDSTLLPEIWFEPWRDGGASFRELADSVIRRP